MPDDLRTFTRNLGYEFDNPQLLQTALTHRSVGSRNNERMEFLGDAVLGYLISSELFGRFPTASEGELSRLRASLVKGDTLAGIARELSLGDFIKLGSGELKSGGFRRKSILADALEAIIGAIYLDRGMDAARAIVTGWFGDKLEQLDPKTLLKDPKTRLQELLQARGDELPAYRVISTAGKAHEQKFRVACDLPQLDKSVTGEGGSRRMAEQAAAEKMLAMLTS